MIWSASQKVGQLPAQRLHRGVGGLPRTEVGSEPMIMCSRFDLFHTGTTSTPARERVHAGLQLGLGLVSESVSGSNRILIQHQILVFHIDLFFLTDGCDGPRDPSQDWR